MAPVVGTIGAVVGLAGDHVPRAIGAFAHAVDGRGLGEDVRGGGGGCCVVGGVFGGGGGRSGGCSRGVCQIYGLLAGCQVVRTYRYKLTDRVVGSRALALRRWQFWWRIEGFTPCVRGGCSFEGGDLGVELGVSGW